MALTGSIRRDIMANMSEMPFCLACVLEDLTPEEREVVLDYFDANCPDDVVQDIIEVLGGE